MGQALKPSVIRSDALLTPAAMAEQVMTFAPASDAEALKILRSQYPGAPLSMRVAALNYLMRRRSLTELSRLPQD
jgi:hypothetical protein